MADKTSNHSSDKRKRPKKPKVDSVAIIEEKVIERIFLGEYYNIYTMQMHPVTKKFVEREAQRLREWALTDEALLLCDFTDAAGYNPDTFYEWCAKYPEMEQAHKFALRRIGSRREKGAMTRQFAESTVHRTLGFYSVIWREESQKIAQMKEKLAQAENKIIVIEKFALPESNVTPEEIGAREHKKTSENRVIGPCFDRRRE